MSCFYPLQCCLIGNLRVHIDQTPALFIYADQIIGCLSRRIAALFQKDLYPRNQKLSAPACILYMNRFHLSIDLHMCNKTIGAVYETALCDVFVLHIF